MDEEGRRGNGGEAMKLLYTKWHPINEFICKGGKSGLARSAIGERSCFFPQREGVVDPRGRKGKDPKSWINQATELDGNGF